LSITTGGMLLPKSKKLLWYGASYIREPLKTMRKSAVYEKFAKREHQNPYKSGN